MALDTDKVRALRTEFSRRANSALALPEFCHVMKHAAAALAPRQTRAVGIKKHVLFFPCEALSAAAGRAW